MAPHSDAMRAIVIIEARHETHKKNIERSTDTRRTGSPPTLSADTQSATDHLQHRYTSDTMSLQSVSELPAERDGADCQIIPTADHLQSSTNKSLLIK